MTGIHLIKEPFFFRLMIQGKQLFFSRNSGLTPSSLQGAIGSSPNEAESIVRCTVFIMVDHLLEVKCPIVVCL